MEKEYFNIKDNCRKGLLKYLVKAISKIPLTENTRILDAGCGSGVPTIFLATNFNCKLTAIDTDKILINVLKENIRILNLDNKINPFYCSLYDLKPITLYDIILSEGLLNAVGFQKGFLKMLELLKDDGYIIIHDELQNQNEKVEYIKKNNCRILKSFELDKQIWWEDYYKCLEKTINDYSNKDLMRFFKTDILEIQNYKENPSEFESIYYVIKRIGK